MAFRKVNVDEETIKDYSGNANYINASGIYEVILKDVMVETSENGSEFINLWLSHNGQEQPIYQAIRLTNNDGATNLSAKLLDKLAIICGATAETSISDPVERKVPIGKGGVDQECMVLADFDNTPVFIRIQIEWNRYDGKPQQRKLVRNFFRLSDKATASEIVNNTNAGVQYEKELAYSAETTYKDGLTKEEVDEWLKNRKSSKDGKKETKNNKPANGFGSRFGAKKE